MRKDYRETFSRRLLDGEFEDALDSSIYWQDVEGLLEVIERKWEVRLVIADDAKLEDSAAVDYYMCWWLAHAALNTQLESVEWLIGLFGGKLCSRLKEESGQKIPLDELFRIPDFARWWLKSQARNLVSDRAVRNMALHTEPGWLLAGCKEKKTILEVMKHQDINPYYIQSLSREEVLEIFETFTKRGGTLSENGRYLFNGWCREHLLEMDPLEDDEDYKILTRMRAILRK